ncbi:RND family transporter [Thermodesulfobacteriota bacterium]
MTPQSIIIRLYEKVILEWPLYVLICVLLGVVYLTYHSKDFRLDASTETLVLEGDKDLKYSQLIESRYGLNSYLVVAFTPNNDLFADRTMTRLSRLHGELEQLEGVESVVSILNVPLLESPPVSIKELSKIQTLESPAVDKALARIEFSSSPLYRNLLVSPDLKTTALMLNLPEDKTYQELKQHRDQLREKKNLSSLTKEEADEFRKVSREFQQYHDKIREERHQLINAVRAVMDGYREDADLFLGGVSMIADDLINFIKSDLKMFGLGVFCFLIITLGVIFRQLRWILLPMFCCLVSVLSMMGILGLFGWEVTVISSNFISLQLIITMAIAIHLIVRFRELLTERPGDEKRTLILETVRLKMQPCLYAALTTIAGFSSLIFCNIKPVITFGWMMSAGIIISLILTFILFPTVLMMMKKPAPGRNPNPRFSFLSLLARFTEKNRFFILAFSIAVLIFSAAGISMLEVENSFIDYFKKSTEIYQGMKVIDQKLGGTTSLDVLVDLAEKGEESQEVASETVEEENDIFAEFEEFDEEDDIQKYWLTSNKVEKIFEIHDYLNAIPETGKVLSLATILRIGETLNGGKPLGDFELALLNKELPDRYKNMFLEPYASPEHNQLRFYIRVKDSEKSLKRNELLKRIQHDLADEMGYGEENVHLTGMLVLYNNTLQSLFRSQILTIGTVLVALMGMFLVLFRSVKIALIAIFPNLLSVSVVLGMMGWLGIPLDMMTITIAAISVGIAVDNTIHYIHRFKEEFKVDGNYINSVYRCHGSIGHAVYYTSITIIIGFSILVLSNFIPTIYFGLLTGLAMFIALIASLTLLPQLLIFFKPFDRNTNNI